MDLEKAIQVHANWKVKLRTAIMKKETIDVFILQRDNVCDLGEWLYSEVKELFGEKKEFLDCLQNHKKFHQQAGEIGNMINSQEYEKAEKQLDGNSLFSNTSIEVAKNIISLKKIVNQ